jgi:hypothetical protein
MNYKKIWKGAVVATFSLPSPSTSFLLGLIVDPEDRGNIFLREVELSPK